jgi:hypothetical protein
LGRRNSGTIVPPDCRAAQEIISPLRVEVPGDLRYISLHLCNVIKSWLDVVDKLAKIGASAFLALILIKGV